MLLPEAALEISVDVVQGTVVDETSHSESEHVLALVDRSDVKSAVLKAFFRQLGDRSDDDVPVLDVEFLKRIALKAGLVQAHVIESILVYKDCSVSLEPFGVCLQGCRIHGDQHVAEIAGGVNLAAPYMNLKTGHAGDGALRGPYLCRIVRKCGEAVAVDG